MKKKAHILLVDDDESTRTVYRDMLRLAGFVVTESDDGQDAFKKFSKDRPDVVFTGIDLPKLGGFGLIERIRASGFEQPFFIVNSHNDRQEDREMAVAFGVDGFFVRGFSAPKNAIDLINALTSKHVSKSHTSQADPIFPERSLWDTWSENDSSMGVLIATGFFCIIAFVIYWLW